MLKKMLRHSRLVIPTSALLYISEANKAQQRQDVNDDREGATHQKQQTLFTELQESSSRIDT